MACPTPDWDAVEALLCERLIDRFPRFSQRAVEPRIPIGMPRWQDDPRFDLRRHVHRHRLAAPGDQGALEAFVGTLQSGDRCRVEHRRTVDAEARRWTAPGPCNERNKVVVREAAPVEG